MHLGHTYTDSVCVCVCVLQHMHSVCMCVRMCGCMRACVCLCMCARVTASTLVESIMNPKAKYCILHVHVCINTVHGQCTRT